jgi:hypothetical protein
LGFALGLLLAWLPQPSSGQEGFPEPWNAPWGELVPAPDRRVVTPPEWAARLVEALGLAGSLPLDHDADDLYSLLCPDLAEPETTPERISRPPNSISRASIRSSATLSDSDYPRESLRKTGGIRPEMRAKRVCPGAQPVFPGAGGQKLPVSSTDNPKRGVDSHPRVDW